MKLATRRADGRIFGLPASRSGLAGVGNRMAALRKETQSIDDLLTQGRDLRVRDVEGNFRDGAGQAVEVVILEDLRVAALVAGM